MNNNMSLVVEDVIIKIKKMIEEGNYQVGDRLPAERILAKDLGVSRNTVREAFRYFETLGVAKTIVGSGTYLVENGNALQKVFRMKHLIEKYSLMELIEARDIFETGTAALAATYATREDKQRLRKIYQNLEELQDDTTEKGDDNFLEKDYEFHKEIAVISRNAIMLDMFITISDLLKTALKVIRDEGQTRDSANEYHKKILEAIVNNNREEASIYMSNHISKQRQLILRYSQEKEKRELIK